VSKSHGEFAENAEIVKRFLHNLIVFSFYRDGALPCPRMP
jgi:hypothetical protein